MFYKDIRNKVGAFGLSTEYLHTGWVWLERVCYIQAETSRLKTAYHLTIFALNLVINSLICLCQED